MFDGDVLDEGKFGEHDMLGGGGWGVCLFRAHREAVDVLVCDLKWRERHDSMNGF